MNGLERLHRVSDAPLLLIAGASDSCSPPRTLCALTARHPMATSKFPVAGHLPHGDDPDRFIELVLDFLTATTAPPHADVG